MTVSSFVGDVRADFVVGLASSFGVDFHRLNVAAIEPAQELLLSDLEHAAALVSLDVIGFSDQGTASQFADRVIDVIRVMDDQGNSQCGPFAVVSMPRVSGWLRPNSRALK